MLLLTEEMPRILTRVLLIACCLSLSLSFQISKASEVSSFAQTTSLKLGDSIVRELGGEETHSYILELSANDFVHVVVEQQGADVAVSIQGPTGLKSPEIDRPIGTRGRESFSWIAQAAGQHVLIVRSTQRRTARGSYSLRLETIRPAGQNDALRIAAEQVVTEGEALRGKENPESLRGGIQRLREAVALWKTVGDNYEEAVALYGSGFGLLMVGDNQEAITDLKRALELFGNDVYGRAITSAALGWPLMYLGETDGAMKSFDLALQFARPASSIRVEGVALYGLGWTHVLRREYVPALQRFNDSLKIRRETNDVRGEALTLTGIGKVEALMGNTERARDYLKLALERLPKRNAFVEGDILSNLGWVSRTLNENTLALDYFTRALPLRRGDQIGEATTLYGISTISQRLGRFEQSIEAIEAALGIIESLRVRGLNQQLRLSYFASIQDYYDFYIFLLMRLDKLRPRQGYDVKALHACERARARGLIDLLAENQINLRHGVDPSLLAEERRIDQELSAEVARQYQQSNNPPVISPSKLSILTAQREAVRARIREASPSYATIVQPKPLTAIEIQREVLDENTVLLEYALGDDESHLWVVTINDVTSYRLPGRTEIEQKASVLNELLRARNQIVRNESPAEKRSRIVNADMRAVAVRKEFGQILIGPLSGRFTGKRLLIVAPGALQYVPFAALIDPASRDSLIKEHELIVLPSATTMSVLRAAIKNRSAQPNSVIAFGDPVFDSVDERVAQPISSRKRSESREPVAEPSTTTGPTNGTRTNFPRLLSSRWEARQIVTIAGAGSGKLFLDFDANRQTATNSELSRFKVVHFATHAVVDNENAELSGIVLSMVDKTGRSQNGFLSSHEIFDLRIPAELVVLSACRTGMGKEFKGEGLIGLTRAFMYAGAARIVVSIWDVDDKPTAELMIRFYRHMFSPRKLQPAAALRAAQLEMLQDPRWHSPYFWAAFMLQGEWK